MINYADTQNHTVEIRAKQRMKLQLTAIITKMCDMYSVGSLLFIHT